MRKRAEGHLARRDFVKGAAVLGAAAVAPAGLFYPRPALSAGPTKVNFSLSWVPEGGTNYAFAAQQFWAKRGLEVPINRGYGSVATAEAVATGQLDIALCAVGTALLSMMKGLNLMMVGTLGYDSTMGVAVPADGPIKEPKDLAGKKVGIVPTSGEAPYFPAYLKLVGVDESTVTKVALDTKVVEQTLINGAVDAITMFGVSSIPVFMTQNFPIKSLLYSSAGLPFYQLSIITRPDFLRKNESLCADFVEGMMEGVKFSLLYPDETMKLHLKGAPELAATSTGEEYARLGMGITQICMLADEAMNHSIGYGDLAVIDKQISTIQTHVAEPDDKAIKASGVYTNKYIGKVTLTESQWNQVKANNKEIAEIMGKV